MTTTCTTNAVEKLKELGADIVVDYRAQNVEEELKQQGTG